MEKRTLENKIDVTNYYNRKKCTTLSFPFFKNNNNNNEIKCLNKSLSYKTVYYWALGREIIFLYHCLFSQLTLSIIKLIVRIIDDSRLQICFYHLPRLFNLSKMRWSRFKKFERFKLSIFLKYNIIRVVKNVYSMSCYSRNNVQEKVAEVSKHQKLVAKSYKKMVEVFRTRKVVSAPFSDSNSQEFYSPTVTFKSLFSERCSLENFEVDSDEISCRKVVKNKMFYHSITCKIIYLNLLKKKIEYSLIGSLSQHYFAIR